MKRLESLLRERMAGHRLLVAYVTAGYPDERTFLELLPALEQAGVDALEIGLPFSDPLADGPVIQRASQAAIVSGMSTARALELVSGVSGGLSMPLLAMGYLNPLLSHGVARFIEDAHSAGISGVIIPDLPLHGDPRTEQLLAASPLARVQLATPASTPQRLQELARHGEGFIYMVSRLGVTGGSLAAASPLESMLSSLRSATDLPLLTGFGISDPQTASSAAMHCDGVIVGSALLRRLENDNPVAAAVEFISGIRNALDRVETDGKVTVEEIPR